MPSTPAKEPDHGRSAAPTIQRLTVRAVHLPLRIPLQTSGGTIHMAPLQLHRALQARFRPLGAKGVVGMALAGIDMVAWDALALVAAGFLAIKLRLGYPTLEADLQVVRAVKAAIGEGVHLMSDCNQALSVPDAAARVRALADEGLYWIEEPCLADVAGMPSSTHLFPEVSIHLLAATPTRHWLEFVDWAAPVLAQPIAVQGGKVTITDTPGTGIDWDEAAVTRYLVH